MSILELFLLAVGLSMDAFAVSICKGLSIKKINIKHMWLAGIWFGGFQALMPVIGYFLGGMFTSYVNKYSHWIAFMFLAFIGGNMIKEALSDDDEEVDNSMGVKTMFLMAIATSIDALAVGVTFACLKVNIILAALFIGVTTFAFSASGVKIGNLFGHKYEKKAEICGGVILILIGTKILVQGLIG